MGLLEEFNDLLACQPKIPTQDVEIGMRISYGSMPWSN